METMKYKVIKSQEQYYSYCDILENLISRNQIDEPTQDEIDLLTLLIEAYDIQNTTFEDIDPIKLLKSFMDEHNIKQKELAELLNISPGHTSDILNYKKELSKTLISKLSNIFKVREDIFNKTYQLIPDLIIKKDLASEKTFKEILLDVLSNRIRSHAGYVDIKVFFTSKDEKSNKDIKSDEHQYPLTA